MVLRAAFAQGRMKSGFGKSLGGGPGAAKCICPSSGLAAFQAHPLCALASSPTPCTLIEARRGCCITSQPYPTACRRVASLLIVAMWGALMGLLLLGCSEASAVCVQGLVPRSSMHACNLQVPGTLCISLCHSAFFERSPVCVVRIRINMDGSRMCGSGGLGREQGRLLLAAHACSYMQLR